jgi:asparagine synthase (glutamine-hydrolysing)
MCGIAGTLSFAGEPADAGLLNRMSATLAHRGPDGRGVYTNGRVGLAHVRLSIIDLEGGAQPMEDGSGALAISFNGEIFNYLELREDLLRKGHRFRTRSDTEVLLHLYQEEGERCVERLNGQWAFAIWDQGRERLFLSRDRLGVRPLFYTLQGARFIFASEIKAIFAAPEVDRRIDLHALQQTLTFWCPVAPRTIFKDVLELPPGHSLTVEHRGLRLQQYWSVDYGACDESLTEVDCAARVRDLLTDATRIRLRADVHVGTYLSGGLDSTIVTTIAGQLSSTPLRTFSVIFDQAEFDERAHQRDVAAFVGSSHDSAQCVYDDIARSFPAVIWHAERPVLRTAPAPLFLLSQRVRQRGYKVVLTGEGADEMFGGYDIFKEAKIRRFCARRPDSHRRSLLLKRLYPYLQNVQLQSPAYLEAFFRVRPGEMGSPFFSHHPRWSLTSGLRSFLADDVRAVLADYDPYADMRLQLPADYGRWDALQQAQYLETTQLLPGYILSSQGDRMAMAHGVEGRFPFLDHRVVEFAASIPSRLKIRGLNEKYILKRAFAGVIPESVRTRSKQPYRAPEASSFVSGSQGAPEYVEELLDRSRLQNVGLFNPTAVQYLVAKVRSGRAIGTRDNMAFVAILATQLLHQMFITDNGYASYAAH